MCGEQGPGGVEGEVGGTGLSIIRSIQSEAVTDRWTELPTPAEALLYAETIPEPEGSRAHT